MSAENPVLRCRLCNKPFDRASTLKRHGYYCRSKKHDIPRSKSCLCCVKAKARCDNMRPACSSCRKKGCECNYAVNTTKDAVREDLYSESIPNKRQKLENSPRIDLVGADIEQIARNEQTVPFHNAPVVPGALFANHDAEILDCFDPALEFSELMQLSTYDIPTQYLSYDPLSLSDGPSVNFHTGISLSRAAIPRLPSQNPRSLVKRSEANAGAGKISNLIKYNLKSYLLMMQSGSSLPPFIHPALMAITFSEIDMEPLATCIALMQLIGKDVQGGKKLFWRNVQSECEHWCRDYQKLDQWQLLAAIQALSIYLLMRLDEGESDYNNLDTLLISAIVVVARQLNVARRRETQIPTFELSLRDCWKDWIFEESIRRVCIIYPIVNMLAYFEPAAMCNLPFGLVLAPLPAKRQLWEADNEFTWKAQCESFPTQFDYGLALGGELIRLDDTRLSRKDAVLTTESRSTANWTDWCMGMDGLGGLVMLVASLVDQ